eukprot:TRINITY_DN18998_c0_g1_i1.p1 TRINITY_DN18998_c0_g1~~TRINITY_DN18998_c0_g1_i1.p1  ORF type:complete len:660 (-),score=109.95 TRINITY_DN18998_c0_g1_i1:8-1987(-)
MEREIAMRLLQKVFNAERIGRPLGVKSIIAVDHLKEYIYIEAYKLDHVQAAISGIHDIYRSKISLVPLEQMTLIFRQGPAKEYPKPEQWARMKRNEYRGDLCQIFSCDPARGLAEVKLIPRVDYAAINSLKDTKKKNTGTIPPKKLFAIEDLHKHNVTYREDGRYVIAGEHRFEKLTGYLIKRVRLDNLEWKNPDVSNIDEINAFTKHVTRLAPQMIQRQKVQLKVDDHVKVTEGEQLGLTGKILSISADGKAYTVLPEAKFRLPGQLQFSENQLMKAFKAGDHVKCLSGSHAGVSGMVVRVVDDKCTIFTDVTREQITAYMSDVTECFGVGTAGVERAGKVELHDLVRIDANSVGVVLRIEKDTFIVLDQDGLRQTIPAKNIQQVLTSKHANVFDAKQTPLSVSDPVFVIDGDYKGKTAVVEHCFRNCVFLRARDVLENNGLFVVKAALCSSMVSSKAEAAQAQKRPERTFTKPPSVGWSNRGGGDGGRGRGRAFSGQRGAARGARLNPNSWMVGKTVQINKGQFKGFIGLVTNATDEEVRVELHTNEKTVTVPASQATVTDNSGPRRDSRSPMYSNTPLHSMPLYTPTPRRFEEDETTAERKVDDVWNLAARPSYDSWGNLGVKEESPLIDSLAGFTPMMPSTHIPSPALGGHLGMI